MPDGFEDIGYDAHQLRSALEEMKKWRGRPELLQEQRALAEIINGATELLVSSYDMERVAEYIATKAA